MFSSTPRGWDSVETSTESTAESPPTGDGYVAKHDSEVRWREWMRTVNLEIVKRVGLSADDIEDMPYRDWFDSGTKPASAACKAIKRAGAF